MTAVRVIHDMSVDQTRPWRVFVEAAQDDGVCVFNSTSKADAEQMAGAVENVVRDLITDGASRAIAVCIGRTLAAADKDAAVASMAEADAEQIASEVCG